MSALVIKGASALGEEPQDLYVEDGVIVCPCHNSHFDITSGDPVSGPAQEPLPSVEFVTSGDSIVITG